MTLRYNANLVSEGAIKDSEGNKITTTYAKSSSLATVATSGSYTDLTNTPTIPAAQVQSDWNETDTSSKAYIQNKPNIPSGVIVDQTYDGTSTNAQSGVAINGAKFIRNLANSSNFSLTIIGNANTNCYNSINIGSASKVTGFNSVAIGVGADSDGDSVAIGSLSEAGQDSVAIGHQAIATDDAIQIGEGTNSTSNSLQIGNYQLLDTSTGLIPDARISSNIARTSQIPTVPTNVSSFTNDSGYITGIGSSDVTTALGYTPADTTLSNLGATSSTNFDGQWVQSYLQISTATAVGSREHNLATYLPNDNYIYEVMVNTLQTYTEDSSFLVVGTVASPASNTSRCFYFQSHSTPNARRTESFGILPVGTGRKLYSQITNHSASNCQINLAGYRRIGTNT